MFNGRSYFLMETGLPDFSWYNIPKRRKIMPNNHKMYQMATKYTKWPTSFIARPSEIYPKLVFLIRKQNHLANPESKRKPIEFVYFLIYFVAIASVNCAPGNHCCRSLEESLRP
jgi:hypothetical protein